MSDEFKPIETDVKNALTKTAEDIEKGYPEHLKELAERTEKVVAGGSKKVDEEHAANIKKILDDLDANKGRTDISPEAKAAQDTALKAKLTSILDKGGSEPAQLNGGLGELVKVNKPDPSADALAAKIGGESRVRFANDPTGREYDAVSDQHIAQAKPADFTLNKKFRDQAKATFEASQQSGRTPYFQFDNQPGPGVLETIQRYAERYGSTPVIDIGPLS